MTSSPKLSLSELKNKFSEGTAIWIPEGENCWLKATVNECKSHPSNPKKFVLKYQIESKGSEECADFNLDDEILLRNTTLNEDRLDDLTNLSYLNDPAVLNTIKCRYQNNIIYTYSGLVLVSLNPYCDLGLYGDSLIQAYSGKSRGELEPHLFAVAEDAFRSMQMGKKNQSIIISGESGAGKTISARYVMRYFASAANAHLSEDLCETSSLIEARVLASNPILEAFGNAKTTRNDNSSRFGKYVQIFFDSKDEISGAAIKTYLLEKTRVVIQSNGERNYHIFYQLLAGADSNLNEELKIKGKTWKDFNYLKAAAGSIDRVNDSEEFAETVKSLKIAGFEDETRLRIFKILVAILYLGNISFEEDSEDSSAILNENDENLQRFAELLGVPEKTSELSRWFTKKLLITKLESVEMKLNVKQAEAAKDAVAKFLYSKVFDFIVNKLNQLLAPEKKSLKFIGVLDIYGFEKFDTNSFEQFCINYANEKLQHEFNQQVFKLEQELYEREQISWSFINYSDNQPCIDMIEIRGGIVDLLDEECRFPNGSDQSFLDKIRNEIPKKGDAISAYLDKNPLEAPGTFTIKHFAYDVSYAIEGFLEKNRDLVPDEVVQLLKKESEISFDIQDAQLEKKMTTGSAFRQSLNELMKIIQSTQVHYIRCIKSNNEKAPMGFESSFVMQQLRAGGIIETIKISAAGYPARWSFEEFFNRYSLLASAAKSKNNSVKSDYRELATSLLEDQVDLEVDEFQIGRTQIFLRAGILAKMEKKRSTTLKNAAVRIQSTFRGNEVVAKIQKQLANITLVQSVLRARLSRKSFEELKFEAAADLIAKTFKQSKAIGTFEKQKKAVEIIQNEMRCYWKKNVYAEEMRHRMVVRIQSCYRAKRTGIIKNLRNYSAKQIQMAFKAHEAKVILKELRSEARSFEKLQETSLGLEKKVLELTKELETVKLQEKNKKKEESAKLNKQLKEKEKTIESLSAEIDEKAKRIQSLEKEIELLKSEQIKASTENKSLQSEIECCKSEHSRALAEQESLHKEAIRQMKESYDVKMNGMSGESGALSSKYEELLEEKRRLEHKFKKIEQYVRTLMSNHIKASDTYVIEEKETESSFDRMGSHNSLLEFISEPDEGKLIKFSSNEGVLEDLLRSASVLDELLGLVRTGDALLAELEELEIEDEQQRQEILLRPGKIIYAWLSLSFGLPQVYDLTEERMLILLEAVRAALSESTDDKKCSLWMTNLVQLYGMINQFIQQKEDQVKQNHSKILESGNVSVHSSPTTQISVSELPPPVALLIRAEVMRLIGDIYAAWLKELCRWFGKAGIAAILEHQSLSNYKVKSQGEKSSGSSNSNDRFIKSLLDSLKNIGDAVKDDAGDASKVKSLSISELLDAFDDLLEAFLMTSLDLEIVRTIIIVLFRHMSIICFNQFLLKRNFISWKRAIQIQFNLSRLEDWCQERMDRFGLQQGDTFDAFGPLLQAVKVIQLAKTQGVDSAVLIQCAPLLSPAQIRKLLANYVPDEFEDGPVPLELLRQFPLSTTTEASNGFLLPQIDLNKLALPSELLRESVPAKINGFAESNTNELPIDMPPTLWKLFVLYLK